MAVHAGCVRSLTEEHMKAGVFGRALVPPSISEAESGLVASSIEGITEGRREAVEGRLSAAF